MIPFSSVLRRTLIIIFSLCAIVFSAGCSKPVKPYYELGIQQYNAKNYKMAVAYFDSLIVAVPGFARGYYFRGNAKFKLNDIDGALKDLNKAIEIKPELADFLFARGVINNTAGKLKEACDDFKHAAKLGHPEAKLAADKICTDTPKTP